MRNRPAVNADVSGRWVLMTALALAGLADSLYLTWYHYDPAVRACFAVHGCEAVNGSRFASLGGVPVSVIGVAGYLLIAAALAARRWGPPSARGPARYATYALAAGGTAFALYLTAIEAFVLHAYCTWCLISAVVITALAVAATADLAAPGQA
ncbi:MAG TPA: vitamin K epoxide reductase family protein [bacterium]|nr:vitamin K epoxide reductase family protein [bacterium]